MNDLTQTYGYKSAGSIRLYLTLHLLTTGRVKSNENVTDNLANLSGNTIGTTLFGRPYASLAVSTPPPCHFERSENLAVFARDFSVRTACLEM